MSNCKNVKPLKNSQKAAAIIQLSIIKRRAKISRKGSNSIWILLTSMAHSEATKTQIKTRKETRKALFRFRCVQHDPWYWQTKPLESVPGSRIARHQSMLCIFFFAKLGVLIGIHQAVHLTCVAHLNLHYPSTFIRPWVDLDPKPKHNKKTKWLKHNYVPPCIPMWKIMNLKKPARTCWGWTNKQLL